MKTMKPNLDHEIEELELIRLRLGDERYRKHLFPLASSLFRVMTLSDTFEEFLTRPGYAYL